MANHDQILRELLEKIAEEYKYKDATYKIEPVSSEGANYSSALYNITVSSPNNEDLNLFAKVLSFSEKTRSAMVDTDTLPSDPSETERFVYQELAEKFKELELKCGIPMEERYAFTKFYCHQPNTNAETVILENLAVKGFEVYDRLKSIDWPYASKAVEVLAKFHGLAMAYEEHNPEEYKDILIKYTNKIEPIYKYMSSSFKDFAETALSVTREENKEKLKKFIDSLSSFENVLHVYSKPQRKPVIIHSDFRPSNIMHRINKNGTIDLIPLDYQTIHSGCCVSDLIYLIILGSDAPFRARYYQRLVDHYYDSLRNTLIRLKMDPDQIYPRKDFDYELREALPYGLIVAIFGLPLITVLPDDAPDMTSDNFMDGMTKIKTSSLYPDRINGVIDDYVKWGVL
ncbi:uncharacterized protein LOC128676719 [Plodia interpunctella]|uniref:uncharacterized protein LOC128676719 n=1 Tax=Plodia interpunctella TaxID=58824 RepID=UPI0023687437|nr:uncharacterized protein LOC128676719 [Plodia interpunctella]